MKQLLLSVVFASAAFAQSSDQKPPEWLKYTKPCEGHKVLKDLQGTYSYTAKMWMAPGAPVEESKGTSVQKLTFDGRYLEQNATGKFMGQTFKGVGTLGYDCFREQYEATWRDNMTTATMISTGKFDPASKTIATEGNFSCPMKNEKDAWVKNETIVTSPKEFTYASWTKGPDGKPFKSMEIVYTRK